MEVGGVTGPARMKILFLYLYPSPQAFQFRLCHCCQAVLKTRPPEAQALLSSGLSLQ